MAMPSGIGITLAGEQGEKPVRLGEVLRNTVKEKLSHSEAETWMAVRLGATSARTKEIKGSKL